MGGPLKKLTELAEQLPEPESFWAGIEVGPKLLVPENIIIFRRHSASGERVLIREYHKWLHNRHLLVVVLQGGLRAVLDDKWEYALEAGMALVVRPYQMHYWCNFTKPYDMLFITFDLPGGKLPDIPNQAFRLCAEHRHDLQRILEARLQKEPDANELAFHLGLLLHEMSRFQEEAAGVPAGEGGKDLLDRIARHVQANLDQPLQVESIAAAFGYSAGHLGRVFKAAGVGNLGAFIRNARFQTAESLLVSTGLSVKEIVQRCGFDSPSTFGREFRRRHGTSPRRFRCRAREQAERDRKAVKG